MILLGELHENESLSDSWEWERVSKSGASLEAIPPIFQEQVVPSCPKPRMWSDLEDHGNLEQITEDPRRHHEDLKEITEDPRRHHDTIPTRASPGKAENGRDGCRHHDKFPTHASPGKAADGREGCHHHDNPSSACLGKASNGRGLGDHHVGRHYDNQLNASPGKASNGIRFQDHPCDGSPS